MEDATIKFALAQKIVNVVVILANASMHVLVLELLQSEDKLQTSQLLHGIMASKLSHLKITEVNTLFSSSTLLILPLCVLLKLFNSLIELTNSEQLMLRSLEYQLIHSSLIWSIQRKREREEVQESLTSPLLLMSQSKSLKLMDA